ncbi:MAG TPA: hypothetical protein DCS87_07655 [Rheinheimera sp.]|nr:hypothetical protein [Rheinheimera sp.]
MALVLATCKRAAVYQARIDVAGVYATPQVVRIPIAVLCRQPSATSALVLMYRLRLANSLMLLAFIWRRWLFDSHSLLTPQP